MATLQLLIPTEDPKCPFEQYFRQSGMRRGGRGINICFIKTCFTIQTIHNLCNLLTILCYTFECIEYVLFKLRARICKVKLSKWLAHFFKSQYS